MLSLIGVVSDLGGNQDGVCVCVWRSRSHDFNMASCRSGEKRQWRNSLAEFVDESSSFTGFPPRILLLSAAALSAYVHRQATGSSFTIPTTDPVAEITRITPLRTKSSVVVIAAVVSPPTPYLPVLRNFLFINFICSVGRRARGCGET